MTANALIARYSDAALSGPLTTEKRDEVAEELWTIAFMFEDAKFVRYDVFGTPAGVSAAPGGFTVGARADDILEAFGSRVEVQPHKYIEGGRYLVLSPEFGEPGRIVFEVDPDGRVTQWRVGVPPQVFYVEGCG